MSKAFTPPHQAQPCKFVCVQCKEEFPHVPSAGQCIMVQRGTPAQFDAHGVRLIKIFCQTDCYEFYCREMGCPYRQVMTPCAFCQPLTDMPPVNGAFQFCNRDHYQAFCRAFPHLLSNPMMWGSRWNNAPLPSPLQSAQ